MTLDRLTPQTYEAAIMLDNCALGTLGATAIANSSSIGSGVDPSQPLVESMDTAWRSGLISDPSTPDVVRYRIDLGQPRAIKDLVIGASNVRCPIAWDIYKGSPDLTEPVYSSGWTDPIIRARMSDYPWATMPWTLGPRLSKLELWEAEFRLRHLLIADTIYNAATHIDIRFDIRSMQSRQIADYVQFGHVEAGVLWRPRINAVLDWAVSVDDTSQVHYTEAAEPFGRTRPRVRRVSFSMPYLGRDQAFGDVLTDFSVERGGLARVFCWLEPHEPRTFWEIAVIGTVSKMPESRMQYLDLPGAYGWEIRDIP